MHRSAAGTGACGDAFASAMTRAGAVSARGGLRAIIASEMTQVGEVSRAWRVEGNICLRNDTDATRVHAWRIKDNVCPGRQNHAPSRATRSCRMMAGAPGSAHPSDDRDRSNCGPTCALPGAGPAFPPARLPTPSLACSIWSDTGQRRHRRNSRGLGPCVRRWVRDAARARPPYLRGPAPALPHTLRPRSRPFTTLDPGARARAFTGACLGLIRTPRPRARYAVPCVPRFTAHLSPGAAPSRRARA